MNKRFDNTHEGIDVLNEQKQLYYHLGHLKCKKGVNLCIYMHQNVCKTMTGKIRLSDIKTLARFHDLLHLWNVVSPFLLSQIM